MKKFKSKTRGNHEYRIYATDHDGNCPMVGAVKECDRWRLASWTIEGKHFPLAGCVSNYDLIPMEDYNTFEIDEPVIVWNREYDTREKRYFAGVAGDGRPQAWKRGRTSFSAHDSADIATWDNCVRASEFEENK